MRKTRLVLALALFATCTLLPAADYGVSALRGNDSNPGTLALPFKTLTKAMSVAKNGDRVFVFAGRYSPTLGEAFPISVPIGVKVLGTDGRYCVIDAEFKTNVANPKDPKVNPVQGTVVRIRANCEFARMSIVNAPRNPANPGDYWWNIALHVDDGGSNTDNVHIHHCYLDEFSRGIFVGGPTGNHFFKNVKIENCVLSRFYVEAINGTINAGGASNNRIVHCTIVGHRNTATNKNYPRACISFGSNVQFDVRNCIIKDADWAGLEASIPTRVTSDYNCFHGSSRALAGVTQGSKDLQTDPGLLALPTVTATVDPHHAGPVGPLWNKGTNIITTGSDIDRNSKRLSGTAVDIGADEFTGTDTWFVDVPRLGASIHAGMLGSANNSMFFALSLGSVPPFTLPGFSGQFALDLSKPNFITPVSTNGKGFVRLPFTIPNDNRLPGLSVYVQSLDVGGLTLSDLDEITFVR